jgi:pimeloyl-ACP methyl ester carboxylesterase
MKALSIAILTVGMLAAQGCTFDEDGQRFVTEERMNNGLVIILPGIEGESFMNHDIREGLASAGIGRGLLIYSWGRPIPVAGAILNQTDFVGNRLAGARIASFVTQYQDAHPGRPVYIVGHSGGGGVAVFAAESLPEGRQVDGLVLLSASISDGYDLTKAMSHSRNGLVNFFNQEDTGLLGVGTTVMGTVDGVHGPSAGLGGFTSLGRSAASKVFQVEVTESMSGGGDPHASTTHVGFVSVYVAPWITASAWPADRVSYVNGR